MDALIQIGKTAEGIHINLDIDALVYSKAVVQGNSGAGKSYLVRLICERAAGRIPFIILDPEGEFASLREKHDLVLIGADGEIPTETASAALLARKLIELQVSAVIDLFELMPQARREYVKLFLDSLISLPRTLWRPTLICIDEAHQFCMDTETEILTAAGWAKHDQVFIGQRVATFDLENQTYQYEPIKDIHFKSHDGEMVRLKSDGIDCLVTPEHRVVLRRIQRGQGRYKLYDWVFCEAANVPQHVYVPIGGAACGDGIAELSDDFLRLLGWAITDGGAGSGGRYISISQAKTTVKCGVSMVDVLSRLLPSLGSVGQYERHRKPSRRFPYDRDVPYSPSVEFYLGANLSRKVFEWLGNDLHRVPRRILQGCSRKQLSCLMEGLLQGDGTSTKGKWVTFYPGKNEGLADDFQEIALKLGISTTKRLVPQNGQWVIYLTQRQHHYIRRPLATSYKGLVWDITVPSGAFVARRNGKVFVTGNCPEKGSAGRDVVSTQSVINLMAVGRKRGFCGLLSTQRFSKLHNDAIAEANNIFIGRTWLDADQKRAGEYLGVSGEDRRKLRDMGAGEFYAFGPALHPSGVVRFQAERAQTTHPKPGERAKLTPPKASIAVLEIAKLLEGLPREAASEARSLDEARSRARALELENRGLRRELTAQTPERVEVRVEVPVPIEVPMVDTAFAAAAAESVSEMRQMSDILLSAADMLAGHQKAAEKRAQAAREATPKSPPAETRSAVPRLNVLPGVPEPQVPTFKYERNQSSEPAGGNELSQPQRRILNALAVLEGLGVKPAKRINVAFMSGYTENGHFNNSVGSLNTEDFITYPQAGYLQLTELGRRHARTDTETIRTRSDLHGYWLSKLSQPAAKVLGVLMSFYPDSIDRKHLAVATGYTENGHFNNTVGHLRTLGVADYPRPGFVAATKVLFPDGLN